MCALKTTYSFLSVGSLPSRMAATLGADFFSRVAIRACACSWTSPRGLASNAAADCAPARSSPSCATIGWNDDIRMSRIGPPMELLGSRDCGRLLRPTILDQSESSADVSSTTPAGFQENSRCRSRKRALAKITILPANAAVHECHRALGDDLHAIQ